MTPEPMSPGAAFWIILAMLLTFMGVVLGVIAAVLWWLDRRRPPRRKRRELRDREMRRAWAEVVDANPDLARLGAGEETADE